jgi:hypothetical protein
LFQVHTSKLQHARKRQCQQRCQEGAKIGPSACSRQQVQPLSVSQICISPLVGKTPAAAFLGSTKLPAGPLPRKERRTPSPAPVGFRDNLCVDGSQSVWAPYEDTDTTWSCKFASGWLDS